MSICFLPLKISRRKVNPLLPENCHPKVFADEFEEVKLVLELWVVFGQPLYESESSVISKLLKLRRCGAVLFSTNFSWTCQIDNTPSVK